MAVIPFFTTFFFMEILQGVQSKLGELDCDLILYGVNHPNQVEESLRHHVWRSRVDGMLFFSMRIPESFVEQFRDHRTPLVLVDAHHKKFDSLTVDNQRGAYVATCHLIALGHSRLGILNANLESVPARERLRGFKRALEENGLTPHASLIKNSSSERLDGFTRESGYDLMKQFIALGKGMPTAVFVSSDIQASGALTAISEAGLQCPEDIAIVGFDDIELASHLGLSTMRQPMFEMGEMASETLAARQKDPDAAVSHTMFVPRLVIRKSCGASLGSEVKPQDQETPALA
jgi:LacI family transcriptional regulator